MKSIDRRAAVPVLLSTSLACVAMMTGCASPGIYGDPASGWRDAIVVSIGSESALASTADRDCATGAASSASYVVVRYSDGGLHSRSLGKSQDASSGVLRIGDEVHVNILDCSAPLVPMNSHHRHV